MRTYRRRDERWYVEVQILKGKWAPVDVGVLSGANNAKAAARTLSLNLNGMPTRAVHETTSRRISGSYGGC